MRGWWVGWWGGRQAQSVMARILWPRMKVVTKSERKKVRTNCTTTSIGVIKREEDERSETGEWKGKMGVSAVTRREGIPGSSSLSLSLSPIAKVNAKGICERRTPEGPRRSRPRLEQQNLIHKHNICLPASALVMRYIICWLRHNREMEIRREADDCANLLRKEAGDCTELRSAQRSRRLRQAAQRGR